MLVLDKHSIVKDVTKLREAAFSVTLRIAGAAIMYVAQSNENL